MNLVKGAMIEGRRILARIEGGCGEPVVLSVAEDGVASTWATHKVGSNGPGKEFLVHGCYHRAKQEAEECLFRRASGGMACHNRRK